MALLVLVAAVVVVASLPVKEAVKVKAPRTKR